MFDSTDIAGRNAETDAFIQDDPSLAWAFWRNHPVEFFRDCLATFEPRPIPTDLIFSPWPHQERLIHELEAACTQGYSLMVEKSRDQGISWLILGWALFRWLFTDAFSMHMLSMKEERVDRSGDMTALFPKLRYMVRFLPSQFRQTYLPTLTDRILDASLKLINPVNRAQITGEAQISDAARAGRFNAIFYDEFAFCDNQEDMWISGGKSTPCRIIATTPNGRATKQAELRFSGQVPVLTYHWTGHPTQSKGLYWVDEWGVKVDVENGRQKMDDYGRISTDHGFLLPRSPAYDKACAEENNDPVAIGQEWDINYITSGDPVFDQRQQDYYYSTVEEADARYNLDIRWSEGVPTLELDRQTRGPLAIWTPAEQIETVPCVIFADVAEGLRKDTNADFSFATVMDAHWRVAATYHSRTVHTDDFAAILAWLARRYGNALLAVENNGGFGSAVIATLLGRITNKPLYESNLYYGWTLDKGVMARGQKIGWCTTKATKGQMITAAKEAIHWGVKVKDRVICDHLSNFQHLEGQKTGAPPGFHDDGAMSFMGCCAILREGIARSTVLDQKQDEELATERRFAELTKWMENWPHNQ